MASFCFCVNCFKLITRPPSVFRRGKCYPYFSDFVRILTTTNNNPLSNDQIIKMAPATGAEAPHEMVSSRYSFVPTIQAVDLLRSVGWVPVEAHESSVLNQDRKGFQKHIIRFRINGLEFSDQERVDLVMHNSHDRGSAYHLMASIWRKICGNGLMTSSELFNFSHNHINFDSKAFVESAHKIAECTSLIGSKVNQMKAIEMTPDEKGVLAKAAHQLVYPMTEDAPIRADQLLYERRYDDEGQDLWTTYNVVQENIIKGGLRGRKRGANGRMRKGTTRAVKSIDRNVRLNKALWVLTEEMARLKTN